MTEPLFAVRPEWEVTTVGDVAARGGGGVQTGPFGSQLHAADYVERGIPSVMPQNIGDNTISAEGIARIRLDDAERLSKYRLKTGDIVYSRRGDVEKRSLVRPENDGWLCGTGCLRIRFGTGHVVPEFAGYYLAHPAAKAWVVQHAVGATMPNLNTRILASLPFVLPSLDEQKAIASVLSNFDNKIELNRRMNETLERIAQAIFRDWFVDFGPTRRKIDGATDPVEIMGGLVADPDEARKLADLFPAKLGDDGLPEGWIETPIGDLARLKGGKQLPKQQFNPDGSIPVFGGAGLMGFADQYNAEGYVITVGRVGAYCGRFVAYRGKAWVNNNASVIMPVSGVPSEWLFLALLQLDIETIKKGAAQPFISNGDLAVLKTVQPTAEVLHEFQRLVKSIIEMKELNERQMATLAATRDLLLPKLMSGEVRLRDAEREIEAVA